MLDFFNSYLGLIRIEANDESIQNISFSRNKERGETNKIIEQCKKELNEYFKRERKVFNVNLEIDGTNFQKRVWLELLKIPYGQTITYKELAKRIAGEKYTRAVANACHRNKIGIIIPCHRVIGANGRLIGYAGGIDKKEKLLKLEREVEKGGIS